MYQQKVVWITGASSGIGEALAQAFAKQGAKLVLSARRVEELERVAKSLGIVSENILILPLDLTQTDSLAQHAQHVIAHFGRIDVLINNGGVSQRALAQDSPLDVDRKIMEVNYFGNIALTKAVLPYFLKQQSGQFIIISSIAGKFGFWFRSAYSAAKHALHGFYESLRLETEEQGVQVLLVCPGKIQTNISTNALKADGSRHEKMDESTAAGMTAEECAAQI
ncbi:MAG: SDR family oxidoreductase, partial [Bacteroidia bacterium]